MTERIDGIIDRLTDADQYSDIAWILDAPVENIAWSVVDDTMRANAEFQYKAGLPAKVVRTTEASGIRTVKRGNKTISYKVPCRWCQRLAGTYTYPNVPKDVWKRHDGCECIIEYTPAGGGPAERLSGAKDLNGKRWYTDQAEIDERIAFTGIDVAPAVMGKTSTINFQNEPQEWFYNKLTDAEQAQIAGMQINTANLNRFLNDPDFARSLPEPMRERYAKEAETAKKALAKYQLDEPIVTYRGVSAEEFTSTMWDDGVATKSFKSTSFDESRAEAFAKNQGGYIIEYHIKPGHWGADVNGVPGANEREFLLNKDVPYKIISSKGNRMVIEIGD